MELIRESLVVFLISFWKQIIWAFQSVNFLSDGTCVWSTGDARSRYFLMNSIPLQQIKLYPASMRGNMATIKMLLSFFVLSVLVCKLVSIFFLFALSSLILSMNYSNLAEFSVISKMASMMSGHRFTQLQCYLFTSFLIFDQFSRIGSRNRMLEWTIFSRSES